MTKKRHIHRLSSVAIVFLTLLLVFWAARNAAAFDGGVPISDIEMEETYGGFQMPNGNFLYFSMDFMHVDYFAHNEPATPSKTTTLEGILGDQSGLLDNTNHDTVSTPGVAGIINSTVTNNVGLTNVGVILGNNNVQQLYNFVELNLAFFQVTNQDQIKPVLSEWMHLAF